MPSNGINAQGAKIALKPLLLLSLSAITCFWLLPLLNALARLLTEGL